MYYWFPNVSGYLWIAIFFILPIFFNLLNVRRIGAIEFTFTAIKVCTLVGLGYYWIRYNRRRDDLRRPTSHRIRC